VCSARHQLEARIHIGSVQAAVQRRQAVDAVGCQTCVVARPEPAGRLSTQLVGTRVVFTDEHAGGHPPHGRGVDADAETFARVLYAGPPGVVLVQQRDFAWRADHQRLQAPRVQ
jgi:hypothetical protein